MAIGAVARVRRGSIGRLVDMNQAHMPSPPARPAPGWLPGRLKAIDPRGVGWLDSASAGKVMVPARVLAAAGDLWPGTLVEFRLEAGEGRPVAFDVRRG